MAHFCSTCSRGLHPVRDDAAYLCLACTGRLRGWLTSIPQQLPLLREALQLGPSAGGRSAGRAEAPLPLRLSALDLLGPGLVVPVDDPYGDHAGDQTGGIPLTALLYGWARYIASEHPAVYRKHDTEYTVPCEGAASHEGTGIEAWCRWLIAYLPHAVTRPWAHQMYDQLGDAISRIEAITREVPQRRPRYAPCPQCTAFALAAVDGEWEVACEACGYCMDPDAYATHAAAVLPGLTSIAVRMTAARAAGTGKPQEMSA